METHVYVEILPDLAMSIKIVSDMIFVRNPYLVKSVCLAYTQVLFRSVYHYVDPLEVKVNRPELLTSSFLTPEQINLVWRKKSHSLNQLRYIKASFTIAVDGCHFTGT